MIPKFANPHSLSQDVEITARSEIAVRAGFTSIVQDENSQSLKRDLDDVLRDTWADALAEASRTKKRRKTAESSQNEDPGQLGFRLVSSMKHPQYISLDPKPPSPHHVTREPDCEDDETQAETRRIRALSVVVDVERLGEGAALTRKIHPKPIIVETKIADRPLVHPLPPLLVTEEVRTKKTDRRNLLAGETLAASPHEPQPGCLVLSVTSASDKKKVRGKKRRKPVRERPPPAYWRPSAEMRGKCMGYALGYPSSWAPDQLYVRDTMKGGVESTSTCHAVHDKAKSE